jgi:UDP-N-acetylmuramoyl-tripeptide--D-alanyl-D-alanine ligase
MTEPQHNWSIADVLEATGGRKLFGDDAYLTGISTDTRSIKKGELFVALTGERYDGHRFLGAAWDRGAAAVLVSEAFASDGAPSVDQGQCWVAVTDTLKALGDLAAFRRRQSKVSVVAITGTNGKTTTKEMTAAVLGRSFSVLKTTGNFNNLIGLPLTLLGLENRHDWAVLELAMNRPGEIGRLASICAPQIGVITNIGAGHLEGVGDMEGVARAKGELLDILGDEGTAVLNIDDQRVCRLAERYEGQVISFGMENSAEVWAESVSEARSGASFNLCWYNDSLRVSLRIPGTGAIYNALAAAAVGYRLGIPMEEVKQALETITSLPGRMEVLRLAGDICLINDTYNANPASMALSLGTLRSLKGSSRGILVIGDMMELGDYAEEAHKELGVLAARVGMACLCATGRFAQIVAAGAKGAGMDSDRIFIGSHGEIVAGLNDMLRPGDWVLVKGSRRMAMEHVVEDIRKRITGRKS